MPRYKRGFVSSVFLLGCVAVHQCVRPVVLAAIALLFLLLQILAIGIRKREHNKLKRLSLLPVSPLGMETRG